MFLGQPIQQPRRANRWRPAFEELEPRYTPANPPTLSWVPIAGAVHYDVWITDLTTATGAVVRNTDITSTSWTVFRPLNPNHSYMWWVRGIAADGTAGPWVAGTILDVTALPAPTLISPVSTNVSGIVAMFTWTTVPGATTYEVWVNDATTGQADNMHNTELTTGSWTSPVFVTPGHVYRWWVRAASSSISYSAWSAPATFAVVGTPVIITAPNLAAPSTLLISGTIAQPTFNWSIVSGAAGYDLWVNDVTADWWEIVRTQVTTQSFTSSRPLTAGHAYQWWVRALNTSGSGGPWSAAASFTVPALPTPLLSGPSGTASFNSLLLTWTTVSGAATYEVWIDDLTTGQSQVERTETASASLRPVLLTVGHTFEWWVRAWSSDSGSSLWSTPLVFTLV